MSEQILNQVAIDQMMWKPDTSQRIAAKIVEAAIACPGTFWPDEVDLQFVEEKDKNCIGIAYRKLANSRYTIITMTGRFRKSTQGNRHSSKIFEYRLESLPLAKRWLTANGFNLPIQLNLQQKELSLA